MKQLDLFPEYQLLKPLHLEEAVGTALRETEQQADGKNTMGRMSEKNGAEKSARGGASCYLPIISKHWKF